MIATLLLALTLAGVQPPTPAPATPPVSPADAPRTGAWSDALKGKWAGSIELPNGQTLPFILTVTATDAATIAIPLQGLADTPLTSVAITTASMDFALALPGAHGALDDKSPSWSLTPAADRSTAAGTMKQSGLTLTVTARKLAEGEKPAGPSRPQTPKPPFPYPTREVAYEGFDGAALNGTLSLPAGDPPAAGFPCALFITGSGTQDRDETLFDHKPFALLADALARAGVASLRVDDRGFNGAKDPAGRNATTELYTRDTAAGVDFLRKMPEINAGRIGLIGHSEGGIVAPAVAAAGPSRISFIVLMAAPGVTGREVLERQLVAIMQAGGSSRSEIDVASARQKATLTALAAGDTAALRASLGEAIMETASASGAAPPQDHELEEAVDAALRQVDTPWMRHFIARDPRADLRRVKCPVLLLNGGKDTQVLPEQNVPEVLRALLDGGNTAVTARVFPGLNHLFQPAVTGALAEYAASETTMDPAVVTQIVEWVRQTAARN